MRTFEGCLIRRFRSGIGGVIGLLAVTTGLLSEIKPADTGPSDILKTFAREFVDITPGKGKFAASFKMGCDTGAANERPVHEVTFSTPFAIARYEVPQNLYEAITQTNPSRWKGPRNSVEMVSWQEAVGFCQSVTKRLQAAGLIKADEAIRLPTESEWEYCCRAGTTTAFSFGESATKPGDLGKNASLLDPFAWHTGNAAGNDPPVGALKPNAWGLYDMHGYLWEFVHDPYHPDYTKSPKNGSAARAVGALAGKHVIRGGSWQDQHQVLKSAVRRPIFEHEKNAGLGFRCVKAKRK